MTESWNSVKALYKCRLHCKLRIWVFFVIQNTTSTLNLHRLKIMIVESFWKKITCWGTVAFEKWVTQCHENMFNMLTEFSSLEMKIIFVTFLKNYSTSASNILWDAFNHHYFQTVKICGLLKSNHNQCHISKFKQTVNPYNTVSFHRLLNHCFTSLLYIARLDQREKKNHKTDTTIS